MMTLLAATILYLSPVIGTGTSADPQRLALNSYGVGGAACIPVDPDTGKNLFGWGLGLAEVSVPTDASIIALPVQRLDDPMTLTALQWATMKGVLDRRGIPTVSLSRTSTLREVATAMLDVLGGCPGFLEGARP